jgi:hypothetical protein
MTADRDLTIAPGSAIHDSINKMMATGHQKPSRSWPLFRAPPLTLACPELPTVAHFETRYLVPIPARYREIVWRAVTVRTS